MYPRSGISVLYEGMARGRRAGRQRLLLNAPVVRLEREGDRIARVIYMTDGREQTIDCDVVLSTLPLPALVNMMSPALPADVIDHAASCAIAASS